MTSTEKTIEQHREEFEGWCDEKGYDYYRQLDLSNDPVGDYSSIETHRLWKAWQAARGVNEMKTTDIGSIGNYYGGLSVKIEDGKFYWSIENYDGENWEEIPKYLYDALMKFKLEQDSEI